MAKKRKYWLFITIDECVLCGRTHETRERKFTRKPKNPDKRHDFKQHACCDHF